jgi:hypothetical protein
LINLDFHVSVDCPGMGAQQETSVSDLDRYRQQMLDRMNADFVAPHDPNAPSRPEFRQSAALEYIAFQLGQINRNFARYLDLLEKQGK